MIDLKSLGEAVGSHRRVARVVIADSKGSTPREQGASMLVWEKGSLGSIGGGRLEHHAMARAVELLRNGPESDICRQPLGPTLGQCCGGSVTLVTEIWDRDLYRKASAEMPVGVFGRRIDGAAEVSDRVAKRVAALSGPAPKAAVDLVEGWLVEPIQNHRRPVFVYGAGHVGAALARILAPLPQIEVTVSDIRARPASELPDNTRRLLGQRPQDAMAGAPPDASHFIMTHEHELDLELCHLALGLPFEYVGLIGSATKWARFRKRLKSLGHAEVDIDRIESPIGDTGLGKHPQTIAIGVAARLLNGWRALPSGHGEAA